MKNSKRVDRRRGASRAGGASSRTGRGKLGATAQAAHIFGEPVEGDGVTVIPVARARWGLGGGGGKQGLASRREGMGGGGGVIVEPAGFIEMKDGEARYRPIVDPKWMIGAAVAGGLLLLGLVRRLRD